MSKSEICKWLTPGLTPMRLVFISYGGSAHGELKIEAQDSESGEWKVVNDLGKANGHPKDGDGKIDQDIYINQFTGEIQHD